MHPLEVVLVDLVAGEAPGQLLERDAALARLESRIAVEELAKRWPSYEVDTAGLRRVHMSNVAGYSNVPVRVAA